MSHIVAVGLDLVEVDRIRRMLDEHPEQFRERVFTPEEDRYCAPRANAAESYAARFAVKEAVMKVLGTGWAEGVAWRHIEVVKHESGAIEVILSGGAAARAAALGIGKVHASITHVNSMAAAVAVAERE